MAVALSASASTFRGGALGTGRGRREAGTKGRVGGWRYWGARPCPGQLPDAGVTSGC